MNQRSNLSRNYYLLFILALLLLAGCQANDSEQIQLRTAEITRGEINETLSISGRVEPQMRAELRFTQTGIVDQVHVDVGDRVEAGEVLAVLDLDALDIAVKQAEISLLIQQIQYERLMAPPTDSELAVARAAVNSAVVNYNSVNIPPDQESVASANMQYQQAYILYQQSQNNLEDQWYAQSSAAVSLNESVQQALINTEMARLRLEQAQSGPDQNSLNAASASIAEAQARLNGLLAPPSELEYERMDLQLLQAQLALGKAIELLDTKAIFAPFSGVISAVNITADNIVSSTQPAITMIDPSVNYVEVFVDELDIGRLIPGQPVIITFDAVPGVTVEGQVSNIAQSPEQTSSGVVSYQVEIRMDEIPDSVIPGFTSTVNVILNSISDAVLVPNWAIKFDRETGLATVDVLDQGGFLSERVITIGLRGDDYSEVLAGLDAGDTVGVSLEQESLTPFGGEG